MTTVSSITQRPAQLSKEKSTIGQFFFLLCVRLNFHFYRYCFTVIQVYGSNPAIESAPWPSAYLLSSVGTEALDPTKSLRRAATISCELADEDNGDYATAHEGGHVKWRPQQ